MQGFSQRIGLHYQADNVESPTVHAPTFKSLVAMATQLDLAIVQWDVANAFMQGDFKEGEELYVQLPKSMGGNICKLLKPLYGIKQAAQNFYNSMQQVIEKFGFEQSQVDSCFWKYTRNGVTMFLISHVDDILIVYGDKSKLGTEAYDSFSAAFGNRFQYEDNGQVHHYLGMEVIYNRSAGILSLVQTAYLQRVLLRFGCKAGGKFQSTPSDPQVDLNSDDDGEYDGNNPPFKNLREVVGSLIYASMNTRPDIAYAVSALASHVTKPTKKHHKAAMRILKYLGGSLDWGISYSRARTGDPWRLCAPSDADYAQDTRTRRSRSGRVIMMCGGPIIWGSSLQSTIALSSTESEYSALVHLGQEICYALGIFEVLGIRPSGALDSKTSEPVDVYCDNTSTINIAENRFRMRRTRHVQVKCLKLQEWIQNKTIRLLKVPSAENLADWFTKGSILVRNFQYCRDRVMSIVDSSALR